MAQKLIQDPTVSSTVEDDSILTIEIDDSDSEGWQTELEEENVEPDSTVKDEPEVSNQQHW